MTRLRLRRRHGQRGFTLVEALVALALVALLLGAVLQTLRWVGAASGFGARADRAARLQAGASAYMDMLAAALPPGPDGRAFTGDAASFAFDGVSDGTAMPPGRVRIAIAFQRGEGGGAIVATIRPVPRAEARRGRPPGRRCSSTA